MEISTSPTLPSRRLLAGVTVLRPSLATQTIKKNGTAVWFTNGRCNMARNDFRLPSNWSDTRSAAGTTAFAERNWGHNKERQQ